MRRRSKKMERVYEENRRRIVRDLLATYPVCVRCWRQRSTDVHEIISRGRGGSITDLGNLVCLCRKCHDWVTQNPDKAIAEGWSRHSWERTKGINGMRPHHIIIDEITDTKETE